MILLSLLISLLIHLSLAAGKKCNMTAEDADNCARKIMFIGDRDNLIPANDGEMENYCNRMKDGIRCIRHFARSCLPPFPQQIFGMFAYDAKTVVRNQCRGKKERDEFMKHVSCFLPKPAMDPVHLCSDRYTLDLDLIKTVTPDWRIPGVCCSFHIFQQCVQQRTQSLCDTKTGAETTDYIMRIINSMTDDVLDFTCGQFETIDSCERHLDPDLWSKLKAPKSDQEIVAQRADQKYFSPVPSMVAVIADYNM